MPKKLHWTKRPGGKKKLADAVKRGYAKRRAADNAGTSFDPAITGSAVAKPKSKMAIAKADVQEFAKIGAHARLIEVEREAERIRIFLGIR